jgi:hypothetical protein
MWSPAPTATAFGYQPAVRIASAPPRRADGEGRCAGSDHHTGAVAEDGAVREGERAGGHVALTSGVAGAVLAAEVAQAALILRLVDAAPSPAPRGRFCCVDRCWPRTRQAKRSETPRLDIICSTQRLRRASLSSFPRQPPSAPPSRVSGPRPPSAAARSPARSGQCPGPSYEGRPTVTDAADGHVVDAGQCLPRNAARRSADAWSGRQDDPCPKPTGRQVLKSG